MIIVGSKAMGGGIRPIDRHDVPRATKEKRPPSLGASFLRQAVGSPAWPSRVFDDALPYLSCRLETGGQKPIQSRFAATYPSRPRSAPPSETHA